MKYLQKSIVSMWKGVHFSAIPNMMEHNEVWAIKCYLILLIKWEIITGHISDDGELS